MRCGCRRANTRPAIEAAAPFTFTGGGSGSPSGEDPAARYFLRPSVEYARRPCRDTAGMCVAPQRNQVPRRFSGIEIDPGEGESRDDSRLECGEDDLPSIRQPGGLRAGPAAVIGRGGPAGWRSAVSGRMYRVSAPKAPRANATFVPSGETAGSRSPDITSSMARSTTSFSVSTETRNSGSQAEPLASKALTMTWRLSCVQSRRR